MQKMGLVSHTHLGPSLRPVLQCGLSVWGRANSNNITKRQENACFVWLGISLMIVLCPCGKQMDQAREDSLLPHDSQCGKDMKRVQNSCLE